jgi:hypothetical protein
MTPLVLLLLSASPVTIDGSVVDTDHQPVANAIVELRDALSYDAPRGWKDKVAQVSTDSKGRFTAAVDFEPKLIRADARDYVHDALLYDDEWLAVPRSHRVTLKLRKNPLLTVRGVVVDEQGAPIPDAMVARKQNGRSAWRPTPDSEGDRKVFTNAAGEFAINIRADEWTLWVYRRTYVSLEDFRRPKDGLVRVVLMKRPSLAVYLVDASGRPLTGFNTVASKKSDGSTIATCTTRQVEGDCTLEAELGVISVVATVAGKTVAESVRLENTAKVDVTLRF